MRRLGLLELPDHPWAGGTVMIWQNNIRSLLFRPEADPGWHEWYDAETGKAAASLHRRRNRPWRALPAELRYGTTPWPSLAAELLDVLSFQSLLGLGG